jgi:hypothetical protein
MAITAENRDTSRTNIVAETTERKVRISSDRGFQYFCGFIPAAILSYCMTPILCLGLLLFRRKPAFNAGVLGGIGTCFLSLGSIVSMIHSSAFRALGGCFLGVGVGMQVYAIVRFRRIDTVIEPKTSPEVFFHYLTAFITTLIGTIAIYLLLYCASFWTNAQNIYNVVPYIFPLFGVFNFIFTTNKAAKLGVVGGIGALYIGAGGWTIVLLVTAALAANTTVPSALLNGPGTLMGVGLAIALGTLFLTRFLSKG